MRTYDIVMLWIEERAAALRSRPAAAENGSGSNIICYILRHFCEEPALNE